MTNITLGLDDVVAGLDGVVRKYQHPIQTQCYTKTAFISSTTLLCLSIHPTVVPEISTSWYQYLFSLDLS